MVDRYVLKSFLFWFVLLLIGFVLMTHVYTFFDLLSDIVKNNIAMTRVFTYLFFLTPQLIFELAPMSVLVAVLITFGILTKHNEITAMKASGVSLYRLAVPVLAAALLMSGGVVRVRALLRAGRQSQAGRDSQGDQGQAGADLSASGPALGLRSGIEKRSARFLLQVSYRRRAKADVGAAGLRAGCGEFPHSQAYLRRKGALGADAAHLDF